MRRLAVNLIVFLVIFQLATPAFGWGNAGHRTVGQIAQLRLANSPTTMSKITHILRSGETLSSIATWADDVKEESNFFVGATDPDSDTAHFYNQLVNTHNRKWHFVNLALGCTSYVDLRCKKFTSRTDIVQLINICIRVLRGQTVASNLPRLNQRNALRMLVHLVGDLHQPLHVGVGFVNVKSPEEIVFENDPVKILDNGFPGDSGGNSLLIEGETSGNLHSFWDTDLVKKAMAGQTVFQFSQSLNTLATPAWNPTGNPNTWAAQWASDTLRVSEQHAYKTIEITEEVFIDDRTKYTVTKGSSYKADNVPVVKEQLAKGGYRLAKLLQAIFP